MQKSKKSFSQHFGIEVESSLQWQSWEPGREYTEIITLTNVDLRAKKLKYRIVNAKYFTAKYPQMIVLNVGAKVIIPITFRPLKKNMFEDSIEFITKDGSFHIPIMAVPAKIQLSTPETINFGMCAVQDSLTISFEIANICDLYVSFQLQSDTPFILQPVSGNLAPRTQCKIKATFQPEGAFVYETAATCTFGDVNCKKNTKTIMLEGIGKFPHLSLKYENITGSEITVDFGEVNLGETVHKVVDINNLSPVNVPFQVIQKSLGVLLDNAFQCSQYHGIVPAEHTHKIKLSFKPENFDMVYIDYFEILPVTLINKSIIKCIGRGKSANVSLNIKSVNFGVTGVGVEVVRSFKLQNGSCSPAIFQLKTDLSYSMFLLNTACGVIEANSSKKIIVKFTPTKPIPYYKKLFCLVHNQEPLVIELFGTCVSKDIRPAVLTQKHIDNNSIYMLQGISRLSPENISLLMEEKKIVRDENDLLQVVDKEVDSNLTKNRSVSLFDEFFCNGLSDNMYSIVPHVCVDVPSMNFGIAKENFLFHKSVCVSNHTHGKVICVWINAENNHFFVTPAENEIAPMSSMSFKVTFKPDVPNKMYGAELEAFVFYKSMRDYRLVDENTITVPWCLTITATGHTFGSNSEFYLPVCSWSSKTMVLPPVTSLDQPIYRTCVLQNDGYNPIHCAFTHDDTCVFSSKPDICLLKEKFHLFVYRMSPIKTGISRFQARCTLNFSEKYNHDFDLTMTTETVNILFNEGNLLYFMPTCIGHKSHQSVQIQNSSRVPIKLRWKISKYDQQILSVEEEYKTILPNEVQNHLWTFTPVEELKHLFKVKLLAHIDNLHEQTLQKYIVKMVGESQSGAISCEEESVAVGEIIVGSTSRTHIVLNNTGGCSLDLFLSIEEFFINSEEIVPSMDSMFQLDHYELCLPSYSSKMLAVTVSPKRKGSFKAQLFYQLRSKSKHEPKLFLCNITVYAVYPHIFVNDIRGAGCAQYYSKKYLLELFKIDSLNHLLHSDPELEELKYNASSRFSTQMKMPQTTRAVNQFDFGSAVQRSDDCIVRLSLENKGNTSVKWVIKYSTDFQLDIEPWANPGTLKDDELHEMFVLKNKIFSVDPLYGEIPPSKSQIVKFSYQNLIKGVHKLPVLFKIIQGREIMLNLLGTTLDYSVNALHLTSLKHTFTSISISCGIPLAQIYTLYNPTNNKLGFEFDLSILDKLQEENYDCRILECLTPTGEVFPRQTFDTQWVFSPVEAKEYHVDVLLTIQSGNSSIISFFGTGLDDSVSKENKIYKDECLSNQFIASPDELLKISTDVLSFGDIPMFSESSQLVFLTNMSEHYDVYYNWKVKKSFISIFPSQGVIKPRNHIVCKVTIHAQGIPSIHKIDFICEITNKTHMDKFVKERSIWSTRLEEKKHLFTICDIASAKNVLRMRTRPESQNVFSSDTSSKVVPSVPLPPIKRLQDKDQLIFIDGNDGDDPEPLAPKSFPVHLFVCVNIHSIKSFFDNFPELVDTVFIQRNPLNRVKGSFHNSIKNSDEEYSLIDNILALLIRDCLEDRDFECSVDRIKEEPIPYYGMFAQIFNSIELNGLNQSKEEDLMKNHVQYITDKPLEAETEEITPRDLLIKVSGSDTLITDREHLKRNDEVRFILKDILDNTLFNLISEATFGEISLTNRPQLISVPPNLGENSR